MRARWTREAAHTKKLTEEEEEGSRRRSTKLALRDGSINGGDKDLRRVLLDVRPRGEAGGGDQEGRRLRRRRRGDHLAGGGDAAGGGAGEDARAGEARGAPGDGLGQAAGGRRRRPVRLPGAVRHDGGADEGALRLHGRPVAGAGAGGEARGVLLRARHPGRRPGGDGAHRRVAARAPRHGVRPRRVHVRRRDVRHGRGQVLQPLRVRHLRRQRWEEQAAQRRRAPDGRAPGQLLRRLRQEAQGRCGRRRLSSAGVELSLFLSSPLLE